MSSDALPPTGPLHPVPSGLGDGAPLGGPSGNDAPPTYQAVYQPAYLPSYPCPVPPPVPVPPPIPAERPQPAAAHPRAPIVRPRALPVAEPIRDDRHALIAEATTAAQPPVVAVRTAEPLKAGAEAARGEPVEPADDSFHGRRKLIVASLASSVFHFALVVITALIAYDSSRQPPQIELDGSFTSKLATSIEPLPKVEVKPEQKIGPAAKSNSVRSQIQVAVAQPSVGKVGSLPGESPKPAAATVGNEGIGELMTTFGGGTGDGLGLLDGRDGDLKQALLEDGASEETELAVKRGLRWLAAHQLEDGSWRFNHHQGGVCKYCPNPGNHGSSTAATGLALLPFLGANHTHLHGEYQEHVRKGLEFLKRKMIVTPLGGDLQDGVNLYSQAIATLALCEAYAMTRDSELRKPCQDAVQFIVHAQDKKGGGWRYFPGEIGDTTVTGWMLMALKSGQLTYTPIPTDVWPLAKKFLDSVQDDKGAAYGYQGPAKDDYTMTSIGILSRMYGGWPRSEPALQRAVAKLSRRGPSDHDLYYNYYATQVLRHYGGSEWIGWNAEMKAFLVQSQSQEGHMFGSWYFPDKHGDQGGRVYNTAMSILILEVYYRHLPIYGHRATSPSFK